jgi:hypothetical protein
MWRSPPAQELRQLETLEFQLATHQVDLMVTSGSNTARAALSNYQKQN